MTIITLFPWLLAFSLGIVSGCLLRESGVSEGWSFGIACFFGIATLPTYIFGLRYLASRQELKRTGRKKSFWMKRSVIIIRLQSKPKLEEWLSIMTRDHPSKLLPGLTYPVEGKRVRLIPSFGVFNSNQELIEHATSLKPLLLKRELRTLLKDPSQFEGKIDALQFDQFFELQVRDYLVSRPDVREVVKDVSMHGGKVDATQFDQFFK